MIRTVFGWVVLVVWIGGMYYEWSQHNEEHPIVYAAEPEEPQEVLIAVKIDWTQERINQEIETQAHTYGVNADIMHKVIKCESNYNPNALGDGGKSRGLVQIHSGYHAVSDEDAYNPQYAIEFLAKHLAQGKGNLWSCFKKI